jgi:tRNA A37 threonylcarbamoyladenosine dehydratase
MKHQEIKILEIEDLKASHTELAIHDNMDLVVEDLFDIEYPEKKDTKTEQELEDFKTVLFKDGVQNWGSWFYYPWLNQLVHFPPKEHLRSLRTSRNRNLINVEEQKILYSSTLLIAGMSVGSNVVEALVSQGIGTKLILADMDVIEPSNLNRIRSPYHHVGLSKVDAISRKVWEIDPYIEIVQLLDGLTDQNIVTALDENNVSIIIDEIDSLRLKVVLREVAKARKLPVLMAADDGDDALLEIERYDLDQDQPIFHGRLPAEIIDKLKSETLPRAEMGIVIGKYFVGYENIPIRMYESLAEVGKSIPSWPQLGGAAALSGLSVAYAARKILLKESSQEGQILISVERAIDLEHKNPENLQKLDFFHNMMKDK